MRGVGVGSVCKAYLRSVCTASLRSRVGSRGTHELCLRTQLNRSGIGRVGGLHGIAVALRPRLLLSLDLGAPALAVAELKGGGGLVHPALTSALLTVALLTMALLTTCESTWPCLLQLYLLGASSPGLEFLMRLPAFTTGSIAKVDEKLTPQLRRRGSNCHLCVRT